MQFVLVVGLTHCRDAVFRSGVVGAWAVRRGLSLSENDDRLACSTVTWSTCEFGLVSHALFLAFSR